MKESKMFTCSTEREEQWVETYRSFGWDLKSSQEINTSDTSLQTGLDGSLYATTKKERYIKLVFERDDRMKGYAELKALQKKYEDAASKVKTPHRFNFFLFLIGLIVIYLIIHINNNKKIEANNKEMFAIMDKCVQDGVSIIRSFEEPAE